MAVITLSSIYMDLVRINISLKILYINKLKICEKRYTYLLTYLLTLLTPYILFYFMPSLCTSHKYPGDYYVFQVFR